MVLLLAGGSCGAGSGADGAAGGIRGTDASSGAGSVGDDDVADGGACPGGGARGMAAGAVGGRCGAKILLTFSPFSKQTWRYRAGSVDFWPVAEIFSSSSCLHPASSEKTGWNE